MSEDGSGRATHVLVMAKAPVAGRVKTRLCPPCSPAEACAIAEAALADTLDAVAACAADLKLVALDGVPGPWIPPGVGVIAQHGRHFGERVANAWTATRPWSGGFGLQIGMDTPQVTAGELDTALALLARASPGPRGRPAAVLGHAFDGGWWIIGLPGTEALSVFGGVVMSTARTGADQEQRLRSLGLEVLSLSTRRDIDTFDDLVKVVAELPDSRTARVSAAIIDRAGRQGARSELAS
jgi:glycosyltransferase A (GT-A) superfamily protein (DUF2064 family)